MHPNKVKIVLEKKCRHATKHDGIFLLHIVHLNKQSRDTKFGFTCYVLLLQYKVITVILFLDAREGTGFVYNLELHFYTSLYIYLNVMKKGIKYYEK